MTRNFILVWWTCLVIGCVDHAQARIDNASTATAHKLAVEKCVDDAIATLQTTGDGDKAGDEYILCADAADKAAGRK